MPTSLAPSSWRDASLSRRTSTACPVNVEKLPFNLNDPAVRGRPHDGRRQRVPSRGPRDATARSEFQSVVLADSATVGQGGDADRVLANDTTVVRSRRGPYSAVSSQSVAGRIWTPGGLSRTNSLPSVMIRRRAPGCCWAAHSCASSWMSVRRYPPNRSLSLKNGRSTRMWRTAAPATDSNTNTA